MALRRLWRLCLLDECVEHRKYKLPTLLLVTTLAYEIVSMRVMGILSNLYRAVASQDSGLFWATLSYALVVVGLISLLKSINTYAQGSCALYWRTTVVNFVHERLVVASAAAARLEGAEQRATQDVDRLTQRAAKFAADTAALPVVIVFYTTYLIQLFGPAVPLLCFLYFALGSLACFLLARRLVELVYAQEKCEGSFRNAHVGFHRHLAEIYLLRGERYESGAMAAQYTELRGTVAAFIRRSFWLNLFTDWFAYTGSIVNYVVVGGAILYMPGSAGAEGDQEALLAARLAEGSYACLYLISALSTLIKSAETASEIVGLASRVSELLDALDAPQERAAGPPVAADGKKRSDSTGAGMCTRMGELLLLAAPRRLRALVTGERYPSAAAHDSSYALLGGDEQREVAQAQHIHKRPAGQISLVSMACRQEEAQGGAEDVWATEMRKTARAGTESPRVLLEIRQLNLYAETELSSTQSCRDWGRELLLLRGLGVQIRQGMRLLVTGPSGCGKSTLLRLLASAERVRCEELGASGVGAVAYSLLPEECVIFCPQTPYCFKGTLEQNLLYPHCALGQEDQPGHPLDCESAPPHKRTRLEQVLRQVGLASFAASLGSTAGDGVAVVRDWASTTSPGERQRVAVARALLRDPAIAFFDEISSALDEDAERVLYQAIAQQCGTFVSFGKTTPCIALCARLLH
mmetsp:Transcript_23558/g.52305  ORF Transcript_23558/g.52305 Transcript_23558/m.52305 type:complete len:694 (+) Transcript_23558:143-2224(+)